MIQPALLHHWRGRHRNNDRLERAERIDQLRRNRSRGVRIYEGSGGGQVTMSSHLRLDVLGPGTRSPGQGSCGKWVAVVDVVGVDVSARACGGGAAYDRGQDLAHCG